MEKAGEEMRGEGKGSGAVKEGRAKGKSEGGKEKSETTGRVGGKEVGGRGRRNGTVLREGNESIVKRDGFYGSGK